jgi:hypothetical protein
MKVIDNILTVTNPGTQLILNRDATHNATFIVNASGVLSVTPTGTTVIITASAAAGASLNIPESGVSPTAPNTGDLWTLTADHNIKYRTNSITHTVPKILFASATLNFPNPGGSAVAVLTVTVTGAQVGDVVAIGAPAVSVVTGANQTVYTGYVSAANTVTIQCSIIGGLLGADPASGVFTVVVFRLN